ncbi:NRAMP family divalent metal transporter [Bergeriella denitrificans]|uniref:Membrane protein n=1 Tax=Bergeriella denitrificans TaxID=494 RepID=A0A378UGQ9_BERDE|nr:divalent metal cation transporter [Bergeriella denitrificans]STZ76495.1 membrane protein [Bergeriella denitrificans]
MSFAALSRRFGPGIIMASSCVGGSHIIASTQAGAYYGYQLAGLIVLVNLLKYPFFRIAFDYSSEHRKTLLQGYAERGRLSVQLFLAFNLFATVVNIAGGTLLSAVLLGMMLPQGIPANVLNVVVLASFLILLFGRQYQALDRISKAVMLGLTLVTLAALVMAFGQPPQPPVAGFETPSPWVWAAVPFFAALTGWMPAPLELSVSSSMWVVEKNRLDPDYRPKRMVDFNTSYILTIILALMFMALGALVQYGQAVTPLSGGKFIGQFVDMYAHSIGEWMRLPMTAVAFACIYGTTIVAVDGYSRCNMQAVNLLRGREPARAEAELRLWLTGACLLAFVLIQFFSNAIGKMIPFAMTASFLSAPVFAALNLRLAAECSGKPLWLMPLAYLGLLALVLAAAAYLLLL